MVDKKEVEEEKEVTEEHPEEEKESKEKQKDDESKVESKEESKASSSKEDESKVSSSREDERPKKKEKQERIGNLNIYTTFNNTIMNLTDMSGKSIAKFSGGGSTKQDRLKANPTIAMFVAKKIGEEARDNGITGFYVRVRAKTGQNNPGPGTHAAIKSLTREGFKILSIMDMTRIPRGGPKKKGGRRGRRV